MDIRLMTILNEVKGEVISSQKKWAPYNSCHEGRSVIDEELDELWDEIKGAQRPHQLRKEALHTAATAIRFIYDLLED